MNGNPPPPSVTANPYPQCSHEHPWPCVPTLRPTIAQGTQKEKIRGISRLHHLLMDTCYNGLHANRVQGTMGLLKHFQHYDHHQGFLGREDFAKAINALGLGFTKKEVDQLFKYYDFDGAGISPHTPVYPRAHAAANARAGSTMVPSLSVGL